MKRTNLLLRWKACRYQALLEEKNNDPLSPEAFKKAIKKACYTGKQNLTVTMLDNISDQISDRYNYCFAGYQLAIESKNVTASNYYAAQLFLFQTWADDTQTFTKALQAVYVAIKEKHKFNFTIDKQAGEDAILFNQNMLNILGILYESTFAAENFYGMSLLLKIILSDEKTDANTLADWVRQCHIFFIDNASAKPLNLSGALRTKLLDAYLSFANHTDDAGINKFKLLAEQAYDEILSVVQRLNPSALEDLFSGKFFSYSM